MNKRIKKKQYTLLVQKARKAVRKRFPSGMTISIDTTDKNLTEAELAEIKQMFADIGAVTVKFT